MTTLYEKIKTKITEAAKARDISTKTIYVTFLAEVESKSVDKNKRRVTPTDDVVIAVAKKFREGVHDTIKYSTMYDEKAASLKAELSIYEQFIPAAVTEDQIREFLSQNPEVYAKGAGPAIGALKKQFGNALDGSLAKTVVEAVINGG